MNIKRVSDDIGKIEVNPATVKRSEVRRILPGRGVESVEKEEEIVRKGGCRRTNDPEVVARWN